MLLKHILLSFILVNNRVIVWIVHGPEKGTSSNRDAADNKKCIRMLRCVRKPCPHSAPHCIQTQLSSRCTAPHRKLNILQISSNIKKIISLADNI